MNEPIFIARQDTLEQEILPAHWLAQYKLFGEESYTFQDKEIWKKLCMSSAAANDRDMHAEALEEMLTTFSAEHTGKWMPSAEAKLRGAQCRLHPTTTATSRRTTWRLRSWWLALRTSHLQATPAWQE